MGKVKIKIRRLESANLRQTTYCKRKTGLMKKAELAILCDVDVAVLKRIYKNSDHDVDVKKFSDNDIWINPDVIDNMMKLNSMEKTLIDSIDRLQGKMEHVIPTCLSIEQMGGVN
ncbi:hypothetical protein Syun_030814 [Stephania yunnanensis]|uniref:MADS-box domain-containing protein n=1 Tax=Stephania yunnanensis TaxID=152371 RepID=A0AAP0DUT1_9MAGN